MHQPSKRGPAAIAILALLVTALAISAPSIARAALGDLSPIDAKQWDAKKAAHLLERAGFGGSPSEIAALAGKSPQEAVRGLVRFGDPDKDPLPPFEHSGIHDPGLEPFPPSRPATTNLAKETGEALGVTVKPSGNRRLQPVVNRFFYWLRASRLETDRVAYWWAERMMHTDRPLQEKMALFWHGHFAVNESKVRDYRKHLHLLEVLHRHGTGNFRDLLIAVAQSPAMLSFLDAGINVKGSPNENFAREIMELFTLGVGHYEEADIREAARAFTGWNYSDLTFVVNADQHDETEKTVLGQTGAFSGEDVIDILLDHPHAAEFVAAKIYRFLVRSDPKPTLVAELGMVLRNADYEIAPLLETILLSRDFYAPESMGTRIKGPVELAVSTYRKLELSQVPGVPDFNRTTRALGQHLFNAPTVAGWAQDKAWITPGLLLARANFAYDLLFPDINFLPYDRYPEDPLIRAVSDRLAAGQDISNATTPEPEGGEVSMANRMADRDEDFNTRYGSYKGWQMAIQNVKPIPRETADLDLAGLVRREGLASTEAVTAHFLARLLSVPVEADTRSALAQSLTDDLGTPTIAEADSYLEEPLRRLVHRIMSLPEYQLG